VETRLKCPVCSVDMEYAGPVEGEGDWVYRSYKCPNCGTSRLGAAMAKKLGKATGWYGRNPKNDR